MNTKKAGRPIGSKSTIPFNLGKLYKIFGEDACPEIGLKWLKENGLIQEKSNESQKIFVTPVQEKTQIKVVNFD